MPRTSKKRANENLNTDTVTNKRGRKKKEEIVSPLPSNDHDKPLDSTNNPKDKKSNAGHKKKEASVPPVAPPFPNDDQTIDDILNDLDAGTNHDGEGTDDDTEIANIIEIELSQSSIGSKASTLDGFNNDTSVIAPSRPSPAKVMNIAPSRPSQTRAMSVFSDDYVPSQGAAPRYTLVSRHFDTLSEDIPSAFREMTIYQLCLWLCKNPNILQLANSMNLSMKSAVVDGSLSTSQTLPIASQPIIREDKAKVGRDFLEELKCLFLRIRDPHKSAIEDLVRQVIKCDLNSVDGIEWLRIGNRHFGDFRNKLLDGIESLIESFKETRNDSTTLPRKEEVDKFIDEETTKIVLRRWLNATRLDELKAEGSLIYLCRFVRSAFFINYRARDPEKTKLLDNITKSIAIPSRNGKNFASNLRL
ncbi:hypothetical protein GLOIN_2v1886077 [Rhizophagus clarus]|uniref:Uncharacterized protein n=1 Tax=Rhizophagus clarus TaxID=94130 RepID=A0A8H3LUN6_9GLOM|nr:hypothetical protein GLOIN_2v1886077 [Rhizophagus clarus]